MILKWVNGKWVQRVKVAPFGYNECMNECLICRALWPIGASMLCCTTNWYVKACYSLRVANAKIKCGSVFESVCVYFSCLV